MEDLVETACVVPSTAGLPRNVPAKVPVDVPTTVPVDVPVKVPVNVSPKIAPNSSVNSASVNSVANSAANSAGKSKRIKRIKLGNRTFVSIRTYCKDPRVNIRDYMSDMNGDRHAMKRGILLTADQWNVLKANMHDIDEGLKRRRVQ